MEFSENELTSMICDNNEDLTDAIFDKYSYLVDVIIHKYENTIKTLKLDIEEVKQEAYYAFNDAIINYRDELASSFPTFISLCIRRKLYNRFKIATANKNLTHLNETSINNITLKKSNLEKISDMKYNPERIITINDNCEDLVNKILISLSPKEKDVFKLFINGFTTKDISMILKLNIKTIYNTVGRIREKTNSIIENY